MVLRIQVLRFVAPHMGAWIEIDEFYFEEHTYNVAPHMGAWIEIRLHPNDASADESHPTWVRGLK